ncbi:MAG TPA: AEC family transporter [Chroococcidiopsis sp.]
MSTPSRLPMPDAGRSLLTLYVSLILWVGLGTLLGRRLPASVPYGLGKFLFWVGVPISIVTFLRQADLSASIWLAPAIAWLAIALGAGLSWLCLRIDRYARQRDLQELQPPDLQPPDLHSQDLQPPDLQPTDQRSRRWQWARAFLPHGLDRKATQGSFVLAAMVGNTGYLGYPVALALVGPQYFAWALFYDTLGSTLGAYGLGVAIASRLGGDRPPSLRATAWTILTNPGLCSFVVGFGFRQVALPESVETVMRGSAWTIIALSLLLIGMRLSQVSSWQKIHQAAFSLGLKMVVVPLLLGTLLTLVGVTGAPKLIIVLQMAMPPAFATLVLAEAYDLDRDLAATALATGTVGLLFTLPIWLAIFGD